MLLRTAMYTVRACSMHHAFPQSTDQSAGSLETSLWLPCMKHRQYSPLHLHSCAEHGLKGIGLLVGTCREHAAKVRTWWKSMQVAP